jgi:hypothetical protein
LLEIIHGKQEQVLSNSASKDIDLLK